MSPVPPSNTESSPADPIGTPPEKRTLLVVDDEEGPRQSVRFVFKDEYNVLTADGGPKAIELARQHPIAAAILDIRMAGMTGIEVLNKLKEIDPTIEVIMLTAYETLETARQALRLGACDYLNKPFEVPALRAAVRTAMERHALAREMRESDQRLKQLAQEIHLQKAREEEAKRRGDIYASVVHDINGPLTIISGFIDTINQRIGDAPNLEGEKLDLIKDRLNRITRQVSNCIQISRRYLSFIHGRPHESGQVGVNQIMNDLGELLRVHPGAAKHELSVHPLPQDVVAEIDRTDLIQILLNLAINALQSSSDPLHVKILAETLSTPLTQEKAADGVGVRYLNFEGLKNRPPLVAISIQDNGPGMKGEVLGKMFEPYFTTKSPGQGTGLGLSIVRRLAEQAHGAIRVETRHGKGTTFTVYFPLQNRESPDSAR